MKKVKILLLSLFVFTMTVGASCVKEKNCNNCITGKWVYLQEPYPDLNGTKNEIFAHFYPDNTSYAMQFGGKIPEKFQSIDTMQVCLTYKEPGISFGYHIYNLTCIEKLNPQ